MDKLKLHTPDLMAANIEKLAALFPGCVTEALNEKGALTRAIDFDQLRQELSDHIVEGPRERYHLDWPGKRAALLAANAPIAKTLRPCREESVDFDTTKNLFIEGDNLDALKLLQETYLGKVKLIYIDPPYNTGNDFIYEDDFAQSSESYLQRSMQQDDVGNKLIANPETKGRYHSEWLTMMYSRIKLARNLLRDDGILLVSIDDHESNTLRSLCAEVFGGENFIITVVWEKGRKNDSTFFSETVEYIHIFAKNKETLAGLGKWREKKPGLDSILAHYEKLRKEHSDHGSIEEGMRAYYDGLEANDPSKKLKHFWRSDQRGLFFGADISSASTSIPDYEVYHPVTKKPCKKPSRGWGCNPDEMEKRIADNRVLFGEDESTIPLKKSHLLEVDSIVKTPVIYKDGRGASLILKNLVGAGVFENPKDHIVLADLFGYAAPKDAIIMDFFAGSGSTAHAVLALNADDGGTRQFVLVQLPAPCKPDSIAFRKGFKTIADVTKARVAGAGKDIKSLNATNAPKLDIGFRVLKIDTSNMADVYYAPDAVKQADLVAHTDNIKPDRTPEDLLFQVLVDWGVDLSLPITQETVTGKKVFFVDGNALAACFDPKVSEDLVKELAKRKPLRAVFRDSSYDSDSVKINVEQIFKLLSPETEVKSL
jgi:adenine-specific DNA-methyltransferase